MGKVNIERKSAMLSETRSTLIHFMPVLTFNVFIANECTLTFLKRVGGADEVFKYIRHQDKKYFK